MKMKRIKRKRLIRRKITESDDQFWRDFVDPEGAVTASVAQAFPQAHQNSSSIPWFNRYSEESLSIPFGFIASCRFLLGMPRLSYFHNDS